MSFPENLQPVEGRISPLTAIRRNCVSCVGGSYKEVDRCASFDCHLWEFRFGQRPHTSREKRPLLMDPEHVKTLHPSIKFVTHPGEPNDPLPPESDGSSGARHFSEGVPS